MYRRYQPVLVITIVMTVLAGSIAAEQKKPLKLEAQDVANRAIADLAGWKTQDARTYLEQQQEKFGSTPEFRTAWALLEIQEGADGKKKMVDQGISSLSSMTKNQAINAVASYHYGEILYEQNKRKEANAAWQAAANSAGARLKEDPEDATALFYRGASLVRTKKYQEAREALQMAARAGFDAAMVNHQIGLSYLFAESWQKAKDTFDVGLDADPRFAPMYFWRAMAWEKLGRKDNLLLDLDQYLKLAPKGPYAGKARAVLKSAAR
jgi:tetratricopeptide (TPR) repeat protein